MPDTRLRIELAYDGTDYAGWAKQTALRTVQGDLEDALRTLYAPYGPSPHTVVAGRTDAGVHARAQVVHTDLTDEQLRRHDTRVVPRKLNTVLGATGGIVVRSASVAADGFDARFSALARHYEYRLADTDEGDDPLQRRCTARSFRPLDVQRMDAAARALVGLHDWSTFCRYRPESTSIRTLIHFSWTRDDAGVAVATVQADAFCHSMVRALVGACVAVGQGRLEPLELIGLRDAQQRTNAFAVMPAKGLTLVSVSYPPDHLLRARAEQTRARRESAAEDARAARIDGQPLEG